MSLWGATLVGLTAVIITVAGDSPRVLVLRRPSGDRSGGEAIDALPSGEFDPRRQDTLDRGFRAMVEDQTGLRLRYVEQLYTFGSRNRDPRELYGGPRVLSVAYLALVAPADAAAVEAPACWRDWYDILPWEDWRRHDRLRDEIIEPAAAAWIAATDDQGQRLAREERASVCFALGEGKPDPALALERYELLYEAALVPEALRDAAEQGRARNDSRVRAVGTAASPFGSMMALDDRRILAAALGRLRGKLAYRPVVFDLLPGEFTLSQLQVVVEALAGVRLHKQNFRRMVLNGALVEATGRTIAVGRGRPAELYRFHRELLRARASVGVGLPQARVAGPS